MKKLILFLALVASICGSAYAGQYTRFVSSRIAISPAAGANAGTSWRTNTAYAQGALIVNTNNAMTYMALDGGTSAVSGLGPKGIGEVADNTVMWIPAISSIRRLWLVQVIDGGNATWQMDNSTTNNDGLVIRSGQTFGQDTANSVASESSGTVLDPGSVWQGWMYVVATGSTITVTEW